MAQYGEVRVDYITYTTGTSPNQANATTTVSSLVNAPTFSGDVNISGALVINQDATVGGELTVTGISEFASGTAAAPGITFIGDNDLGLFTSAANTLDVTTNGSRKITVLGNGNIGVGTSSPAQKVEIASSSPRLRLTDNNTGASSSNSYVEFHGSDSRAAVVYTNGDGLNIQADSAGGNNIVFKTGGTNERARIDDTGKVGIGTSTPERKLHVVDANNILRLESSSTTASRIEFKNTASSSGDSVSLGSVSNDMQFVTSGSEKVRIKSGGNVGIGTSSPGTLLHLSASAPQITLQDSDGTNQLALIRHLSTATYYDSRNNTGAGHHIFRLWNGTTYSEKMRVGSNGNIGIGTVNPDAKLEVVRNSTGKAEVARFRIEGQTNNPMLRLFSDESNKLLSIETSGSVSGSQLAFASSGGEAMRITSDRQVGIGTSGPSARLHVRKDGTAQAIQKWQSDLGVNNRTLSLNSPSSDSATEPFTFVTGNSVAFEIDSNEILRVASNGNVGIGTTSPSQKLHVVGTTRSTTGFTFGGTSSYLYEPAANSTSLRVGADGPYAEFIDVGSNTLEFGNASGELALTSTGTERVRIKNNGNVGIGTSSPSTNLHLAAPTPIFTIEDTSGANTSSSRTCLLRDNNAYQIQIRTSTNGYKATAYSMSLDASGPTSHQWRIGNSEKVRIDSSGKLLLGTSTARANFFNGTDSPNLQLEATTFVGSAISCVRNSNSNASGGFVLGKTRGNSLNTNTVVQSGDNLGHISFQGADGSQLVVAAKIAAVVDGTPGADDMPGRLVFSTTADGANSPTERMRINANGAVLIGGATAVLNNEKLYCNQIAGFQRGSNGTTVRFYRSSTEVGSISVTTTATAYNTSSDYRLKENVVDLTGAADRVNQLQVRRFNFIADPDNTVDGFLAHEAQAVVPEAVTGTKDEVDDDGNAVMQSIDQSKLVPLLTAALQEALAEIESLKARVTALEP
jgi:hypothetical protein